MSGSGVGTVAVIGGGLMGTGIAEVVARSGFAVHLVEVSADAVEEARGRIETSVARALSSGKLEQDQADRIWERLGFGTDLEALPPCDLAIEAVGEDLAIKLAVFRRLDATQPEETVLASNTSSLPIAELAAVTSRPDRILGLHFFSPAPVMRLVEVVRALETSERSLERANAFVAELGKAAIPTKDRSGFIVNMLLVPYLVAAVRMYEDGFAAAEAIDEGMKLGCGHPMGPLELCDFIGLDVLFAICQSLYDEFKQPEYAPPPLLKRMVASGRLGRKADRGFYAYSRAQGGRRRPV